MNPAAEFYLRLLTLFSNLPRFHYDFDIESIPFNGLYIFYQEDEFLGETGKERIVRIGINERDGKFRQRLIHHFHHRSLKGTIFRKHLARCFVNQQLNNRPLNLLTIVERDSIVANIQGITSSFSFCFLPILERSERKNLEKALIGTINQSGLNVSSQNWIGKSHPNRKISDSGLFNIQHLNAAIISNEQFNRIEDLVN
ncbi:MAG TPA: hypothetical protein VE978_07000 [Chitinophagales bacterium]|nr:hypothetical protein [Chitinophagales bacterium]